MKFCVTFTLTHPAGKAVYIPNHSAMISQIYAVIKAFFSTRDESGLTPHAPKVVLVAITQLSEGTIQGRTQQNA
jgi:hypothetical protein